MSLSSYNGENSFTIKGKTYLKRGGNNIYDIVNAAGTSGNFSTGWVQTDGTTTVANGAKMQFDHNLGTTDVTVDIYVSAYADGSSSRKINTDIGSSGTVVYGAQIQNVTTSSLTLQLGSGGYIELLSNGTRSGNPSFSSKYIKVIASAGGSGGGNGFIFSARGEGSAPLLIDDRVIYSTQMHETSNWYSVRVADKTTGEILQSVINQNGWPTWAGGTSNQSGYRANGIVDWKNATASSVDIYYYHTVSWVAKATFNRNTQTLGSIEPFGVDATGVGSNFFNYNWQPIAVIDNGSNKEFLSAYALASGSWNDMRAYNLAKMEYRMISPSYNIPDYKGVYQKLPDLMDIAKSTNGDLILGPTPTVAYHIIAGVNPINGKFYTFNLGSGILNIFRMTGSYSDWGARLYELTDSPQPTSTAGIEHLKAVQLGTHGTYSRYAFVSVQFDEYGNETGISFGALVDDSYRRNDLTYIIPWNSNW
jgi:hypothetical protein